MNSTTVGGFSFKLPSVRFRTKERDDYDDDDDDDDDYDDDDDDIDEPDDKKNLKRALGAVTVVAALAIILAVVLFFDSGNSGDNSKPATQPASSTEEAAAAVASAHDNGPATVITDDPSCAAWTAINTSLAKDGQGIWNDRDRSVPASAWDEKQRVQFTAAAQSMRNAAAQTVGLVKLTPHRIMRELYEQFIAYAFAYVSHVPKYVPSDDNFAGTANSAASALGAICTAITDGSAAARGPMVPPGESPAKVAPVGSPTNPKPFLTSPNPTCPKWKSALEQFGQQTAAWQSMSPNIPVILWSDEQKAANYAAAQVMTAFAGNLEQLGRDSKNLTWQDFANLSAQYRRAFALSVPTYAPADNHLANAASYLSTTILGACAVIQGT
ncbi:hypothetical protein [Mycobacterium alsense]|uniref:hypothetical protein n=1 Tax=Mycobacterium alsense TaxID=324058 RepID=UPI001FCF870A|nr:hypothetical protein [Mycobacterium alsense]